jgi:hypothetical protein
LIQSFASAVASSLITTGLARPVESAEPESRPAFAVAAVLHDEKALAGAHDVEVRGGYAYTAGKGGSLAIIDVRASDAPRPAWSINDPVEYEDAETVLPLGERLVVGSRDLALFDVRRPSQPKRLGLIRDRVQIDRINGAVHIGDTILAANKEGYIVIAEWDGVDGLHLRGARSTAADGLTSPHDLDAAGELLVVADGNGFGRGDRPGRVAVYRFRESAESAPWPAEKWALVGRAEDVRLAGCNRVRVRGRTAIAVCSVSPKAARQPGRNGSTHLIDLANPAAPRIIGSINFPDSRGPNGMTLEGDVAFVCGGRTVQAVDVSQPARPELLGTIDLSKQLPGGDDDLHDADYENGRLYVTAQTSHALVVLEVKDARMRAAAEGR